MKKIGFKDVSVRFEEHDYYDLQEKAKKEFLSMSAYLRRLYAREAEKENNNNGY